MTNAIDIENGAIDTFGEVTKNSKIQMFSNAEDMKINFSKTE